MINGSILHVENKHLYLDVREFGAVGDGIADDTAAVQAAIDKGAETGMAVYISDRKSVV